MLENIRVLAAASLASSFKSRQERLEQKEAEEVKALLQRPSSFRCLKVRNAAV